MFLAIVAVILSRDKVAVSRVQSSAWAQALIINLATPVNFQSGEEAPGEMTLSSILNLDSSNYFILAISIKYCTFNFKQPTVNTN